MKQISTRSLGKIAWTNSSLVSRAKERGISSLQAAPLKKTFEFLPGGLARVRPELCRPGLPPTASFHPARCFTTGNERKNFTNWHLLSESFEAAIPRAVPYNSRLIRSISKGSGVLKKDETGLIYLAIDKQFIGAFAPYLETKGVERPPYFAIFSARQGAHIPIISKREADFNYVSFVKELGRDYPFEVEGLYSITPDTWPEMEEVWFLKVRSLELEGLRRGLFLTVLPKGHSFHIVVGVKPRSGGDLAMRPQPYLRINPASLPA